MTIPSGQKSGSIRVTAAATAAPGRYPIRLIATLATSEDAQTVDVSVRPAPSLGLKVAERALLNPGQRQTLQVEVTRTECAGPVEVQVEALPAHMKAEPVRVGAKEGTASLVLTAGDEMEAGTTAAKVVARLGSLRAESEIQIVTEVSAGPVRRFTGHKGSVHHLAFSPQRAPGRFGPPGRHGPGTGLGCGFREGNRPPGSGKSSLHAGGLLAG